MAPRQRASRQHNQIFLVFLHQRAVDARHVVETFGVGLGRQLGQIVVAVFVFGQKHRGIAIVLHTLVVHVATHVQLCTDDGLDALFVASPNELERRHHVAVVGHRQRGHAHVFGRRHQLSHAHRLEDAELGMDVQMREWNLRQCSLCRCIDLSTIRLHLLFDLRRLEIGGLQLGRLVLDGCRIGELRADDHLQANHLKQAPGRGSDIVRRVVRIAKPFAEELLVELRQGRPLEFAAAPTWDGAVFGAFVFGIDDANPGERSADWSKTSNSAPTTLTSNQCCGP